MNKTNFKFNYYIISALILFAVVIFTLFYLLNNPNKPNSSVKESGIIYTSFYPLQYITKQIVKDSFEVVNLTPIGSEPHDFEPSAKDLANLNNAAAFVYIGEEIDPWAAKKAEEIRNLQVTTISAAQELELDKAEEGKDPHFWLDPILVKKFSEKIYNQLSLKYPEKSNQFKLNLDNFNKTLISLDNQSKDSFKSCKYKSIIVSHDAYSYFGKRYGIEITSISGLSSEEEPSASKIAEIIDLVKKNGINYIFLESLGNPKITEVITSSTGAKTLELNPIEFLTSEQSDQNIDYVSIYKANLGNLKKGLVCE
jgi:zinc transport system substrate-binding protein